MVIDLYTRVVIGWSIADHMQTCLIVKSRTMAHTKEEEDYGTKQSFIQIEAAASIVHFIGLYNTKRLHSYNDYHAPLEMKLKW